MKITPANTATYVLLIEADSPSGDMGNYTIKFTEDPVPQSPIYITDNEKLEQHQLVIREADTSLIQVMSTL